MKKYALGIDIGGTNTAFGVVDLKGEIIFSDVLSTKEYDEPKKLVIAIYEKINKNNLLNEIRGIGVGAPNGNYFTGNIEFAPNLIWKGIVPLVKLFEQQFNIPTIINNDANVAAVGEMIFGSAKGLKNFVTITLGTGVGSGIVIDGKLVYGEHSLAGEYGHIVVEKNGRLCACGRKGCLETYTSATGVSRSIKELKSDSKNHSQLFKIQNPTSKDVVELASQGDCFAREILEYTAKILGEALADFMCFSNPKAYILFGGVAHAGKNFVDNVKKYMEQSALKIYQNKTDVLISTLQDKNAAVLGAAALVFDVVAIEDV